MDVEPPGDSILHAVEASLGTPIDDGTVTTSIEVERIGGIERAELSVLPGITILAGENATNRTSLLRAINGVLGGTMASLRSDAGRGEARLVFHNGTHSVSFDRRFERVAPAEATQDDARHVGNPMSEDPETVDSFVSILETNPARRVIDRGGNGLRDVLLGPVDTEAIERQIVSTRRRRDELTERIEEIDGRLADEHVLRERHGAVKARQSEVNADIATLEDQIDQLDATKTTGPETQRLLEDLDNHRTRLRTLNDDVELKQSELDALTAEAEAIEERRAEIKAAHDIDTAENACSIDDRIDELRRKRRTIDDRQNGAKAIVEELVQLISLTERLLDDSAFATVHVADDIDHNAGTSLTCWTCGSETRSAAVEKRLNDLRDRLNEQRTILRELENEYQAIDDELATLDSIRETYQEQSARLELIQEEQQTLVDDLEELRHERSAEQARVAELEADVASVTEAHESTLVESKSRLSDLRHERGRLDEQRASISTELDELEALAEERSTLVEKRSTTRSELENLRKRISTIERQTIERFNETMAAVVSQLNYQNIGRVWITRLEERTQTRFELQIAREENGTTWADTIDHLSESERTVVGIVVAITGYIVHKVGESVPFLLLDSVEAIDADRLVSLTELLLDHTTFLLVALLPEDAAAFADDYVVLTPEQWQAIG